MRVWKALRARYREVSHRRRNTVLRGMGACVCCNDDITWMNVVLSVYCKCPNDFWRVFLAYLPQTAMILLIH